MDYKDREIILFAKLNFHRSCLLPVADELTKLDIPHRLTSKRHLVYDEYHERGKFKIMVIADEWFNLFRECADIMIGTGHSMVSKNTTFNERNSEGDYICVTSPWQKNEFIQKNVTPRKEFWVTGYPAADKIMKGKLSSGNIYLIRDLFMSNLPNLLIAPTYNRDLNLMDDLMKHEKELGVLSDYFNIIFKPHPVLPKKYPEQTDFMRKMAQRHGRIFFVEDSHSDISDCIIWSDVVLGDCSGALILALASNKPIIAYNNPNRFTSLYYDPEGMEWKHRSQYAYQVEDLGHLQEQLRCVVEQDCMKKERTQFRNLIYGESVDGDSAKRIALKIKEVIENV